MGVGYTNTFITIAPDCPAKAGVAPDQATTIAGLEYGLLTAQPYELTGEDLILAVHARRRNIADSDLAAFRAELFSKPHPCFRASMLSKRFGWGAHFDADGKIALYGAETEDYRRLTSHSEIKLVPAMRNRRDR